MSRNLSRCRYLGRCWHRATIPLWKKSKGINGTERTNKAFVCIVVLSLLPKTESTFGRPAQKRFFLWYEFHRELKRQSLSFHSLRFSLQPKRGTLYCVLVARAICVVLKSLSLLREKANSTHSAWLVGRCAASKWNACMTLQRPKQTIQSQQRKCTPRYKNFFFSLVVVPFSKKLPRGSFSFFRIH